MIEVWIDENNSGEVFFCEGGRIDLHIRSGTVSSKIRKIMDLSTNSMEEAHKMFHQSLEDSIELDNQDQQEGWD